MKVNKDLVLSISFNKSVLNFYKLKTIRGSLIFFDDDTNFYGSWDDLWHVLNNLSNLEEYHWTTLIPTFIAKDFKRIILSALNKHKNSIEIQNMGGYMEFWDNWESILFFEESTFEFDISCLRNEHVKSIVLDYNSVSDTKKLFTIANWYFKENNECRLHIFNLSTGKKIKPDNNGTLSDNEILPGDLLRLEL